MLSRRLGCSAGDPSVEASLSCQWRARAKVCFRQARGLLLDRHPDIDALVAQNGLQATHPPAVLAEAAAWQAEPGIDDPALVDLTHLPFVTIDEETSLDLDQALCIQPDGEGWVVWYALADASFYVPPGSALWAEALKRGASYYLPGLVIPMLPRVLSEDLVSLNPRVDRRAMVFRIRLDAQGACVHSQVLRARVHCRAKLWFDLVQDFLDGKIPCPAPEAEQGLRLLNVVGERRLARAHAQDVVPFRRVEISVQLAEGDPRAFVGRADLRNQVQSYNAQISLLCNEVGARFLRAGGGQTEAIYRVHPPPVRGRLAKLSAQVDKLVAAHGLDPAVWAWHPDAPRSMAQWLGALPETGPQARLAQAIHRQAMMANGRAVFSPDPGVHHSVGAEVYGRFSAPMREIVGIFVHEEAVERLRGAPFAEGAGVSPDAERRAAVIAASTRARALQRQLDQAVNLLVLSQLFDQDGAAPPRSRPRRPCTILGITKKKVHIGLDDPPIDAKVYVSHLSRQAGCRLTADGAGARLCDPSGRVHWKTGDAARVRVVGWDAQAARWELALEG